MEKIYLDSLFVLELTVDYLLLLCTARLMGLVLKRRRYLLSAIFGAGYSLLSLLPALGFLPLPLMKLCSGLALSLIAFGAERDFFRCTLCFFAVSALFGGALWALTLAGGRPALDLRTLFLSFAIIYMLLRLTLRQRLRLSRRAHAEAFVRLGDKSCRFMLLLDSGNCLKEPVGGREVLVASPEAVAALFPGQEPLLSLEGAALVEAAAALPELRGKLRLIPYSALGGSGLLAGFVPDEAEVDGEARQLVVALSPAARGEGFEGIL